MRRRQGLLTLLALLWGCAQGASADLELEGEGFDPGSAPEGGLASEPGSMDPGAPADPMSMPTAPPAPTNTEPPAADASAMGDTLPDAAAGPDAAVGADGELETDPEPPASEDGCPDDSIKTEPGVCGCGVSDADSDGDGTPDCNDVCPADDTDSCLDDTPPDDSCSQGLFEGHIYWFCTNNADWDPARGACQAIGGDLVSINTPEEQAFIDSQTGGGEWLIGLNKKNASGTSAPDTWEWVDGTDLSNYSNWNSGEPDNNDCGILNSAWRDFSCSNGENWICEVP